MSIKTLLAATATAALLTATPALAQTVIEPASPHVASPGMASPGMASPGMAAVDGDLDPRLMTMRIDDLDDADVYGAKGEEIGEIEKVVRRDGQLYAVFDADEFLDMTDHDFVIPLNHFRYVDERLTLPITEEQLDALQEFKDGDFEDFAEEHDMTVGDLYGPR